MRAAMATSRPSGWRARFVPAFIMAASLAFGGAVLATPPANAALPGDLTAQKVGWNVVGLRGNDVVNGPNRFLNGVRLCATGGSAASGSATWTWTTSATQANVFLSTGSPATTNWSIAPGYCTSIYWVVEVAKDASSIGLTRDFEISVTPDGSGPTVVAPSQRIYVQGLNRMNRNSVGSVSGPGLNGDTTPVYVGQEYTYTINGSTATQGYEQLVFSAIFEPSLFEILDVSQTYTANSSGGLVPLPNPQVYADACGWTFASGTYGACTGAGKAGGTITSTYTVRVKAAGTSQIDTLIYDYSGAAINYNQDFGSGPTITTSTPYVPPPPPPGPTESPTPTPTPTPTPDPSPTASPVPSPLDPGQSELEVDGVPVPVVIQPNGGLNGLDVTGDGWTMTLDGLGPDGKPLNLGPDGVLILDAERDVRTTGTGFKPGSLVYLYIDPPVGPPPAESWFQRAAVRATQSIFVGTLTVDGTGNFDGVKTLADGIEPGKHVLQAIGTGTANETRVLSLGVLVRPWIVLDQGTRTAAGMHDRMQTTGDSGGVPDGARLTPSIRYSGQAEFKTGKATITVRDDGTFTWKRLIRKDKGLTAYVAYVDLQSNRVFWPRVR